MPGLLEQAWSIPSCWTGSCAATVPRERSRFPYVTPRCTDALPVLMFPVTRPFCLPSYSVPRSRFYVLDFQSASNASARSHLGITLPRSSFLKRNCGRISAFGSSCWRMVCLSSHKLFSSPTALTLFSPSKVAQALGYFLPTLYLPTFGSALGLSGEQGSGLLACVNGTPAFVPFK